MPSMRIPWGRIHHNAYSFIDIVINIKIDATPSNVAAIIAKYINWNNAYPVGQYFVRRSLTVAMISKINETTKDKLPPMDLKQYSAITINILDSKSMYSIVSFVLAKRLMQ